MCLPRPDVLELWNELEQARDTLAQIQALHMEVTEKRRIFQTRTTESHSKMQTVSSNMSSQRKKVVCKAAKTNTLCCKTDNKAQNIEENIALNKSHKKPKKKIMISMRYLILSFQINNKIVVLFRSHDKQKQQLVAPTSVVRHCKPIIKYMTGVVKGSTVLACCEHDGFYYKGIVLQCIFSFTSE